MDFFSMLRFEPYLEGGVVSAGPPPWRGGSRASAPRSALTLGGTLSPCSASWNSRGRRLEAPSRGLARRTDERAS